MSASLFGNLFVNNFGNLFGSQYVVKSGTYPTRRHRSRTMVVLPYDEVSHQLTPAQRLEQQRLDAVREQMQGVFAGSQPHLQAMVDAYRAEQQRITSMTESEKQVAGLFKDLNLQ